MACVMKSVQTLGCYAEGSAGRLEATDSVSQALYDRFQRREASAASPTVFQPFQPRNPFYNKTNLTRNTTKQNVKKEYLLTSNGACLVEHKPSSLTGLTRTQVRLTTFSFQKSIHCHPFSLAFFRCLVTVIAVLSALCLTVETHTVET